MNKKYLIFNLLLLNFLLMGIEFTFAVDYFLENNEEIDIKLLYSKDYIYNWYSYPTHQEC